MTHKQVLAVVLAALLFGAAGLLLGSGMVQAQSGKAVLQAQEFRLVDQKGVARASITLTATGNLLIALRDIQGQPTQEMLVTPELVASSKKTAAAIRRLDAFWRKMMPQK